MIKNFKKWLEIKREIKNRKELICSINDQIQYCLDIGDIEGRIQFEDMLKITVDKWLTLEEELVTGKYKEDM